MSVSESPRPSAEAPPAPNVAPPAVGGSDPVVLDLRKAERAARRPAEETAKAKVEKPAPAPEAPSPPRPTPAPAVAARARGRHWAVALSFVLCVLLPTALCGWYLWDRAAPRYASTAGFSVRTEDVSSAAGLLGGLVGMAGGSSSSSDTDILYQFIQSQEIVALVDARLDLRGLWSRPGGGWMTGDPVFAYAPGATGPNGELGTIEDLHAHWRRMVSVYNDPSTGLLDIEVQAFDPADAHAVAQAVYEESGTLINRLSAIAQADATRFAREELATAVERLKDARSQLTRFRNVTQIIDPALSMQGQMGILTSLESELATQLIDLDVLRQTAPAADPRIAQAERRVAVIEARMSAERAKMGLGQPSGFSAPAAAGLDAPPTAAPDPGLTPEAASGPGSVAAPADAVEATTAAGVTGPAASSAVGPALSPAPSAAAAGIPRPAARPVTTFVTVPPVDGSDAGPGTDAAAVPAQEPAVVAPAPAAVVADAAAETGAEPAPGPSDQDLAGVPSGLPDGGTNLGADAAFADLVGEFERLLVDQEFAAQSYTAALTNYDAALAESRRQSRYLAAHVQPTMPQRATHPQAATLTFLTALFATLAWVIATLAAYAIRDRR